MRPDPDDRCPSPNQITQPRVFLSFHEEQPGAHEAILVAVTSVVAQLMLMLMLGMMLDEPKGARPDCPVAFAVAKDDGLKALVLADGEDRVIPEGGELGGESSEVGAAA